MAVNVRSRVPDAFDHSHVHGRMPEEVSASEPREMHDRTGLPGGIMGWPVELSHADHEDLVFLLLHVSWGDVTPMRLLRIPEPQCLDAGCALSVRGTCAVLLPTFHTRHPSPCRSSTAPDVANARSPSAYLRRSPSD